MRTTSEPATERPIHLAPDRRKSFARRLREAALPISIVAGVVTATAGVILTLAKPFAAKASAKDLEEVRKSVSAQDERIDKTEQHLASHDAMLDDFKRGQDWMLKNQFEMARQLGLRPDPTPAPHLAPSPKPTP